MLQTAGPPLFPNIPLPLKRRLSRLRDSPKLRWTQKNIVVLLLTFPRGEWRERNRERRNACIDRKSWTLGFDQNCKAPSTSVYLEKKRAWEDHNESPMRPGASGGSCGLCLNGDRSQRRRKVNSLINRLIWRLRTQATRLWPEPAVGVISPHFQNPCFVRVYLQT